MFSFIKRHKAASVLICLNLIAVILVIAIIIIHKSKTAMIDINFAPAAATITLNNQAYANQESHNIAPGDYHVKISMEGMQSQEYDLTLDTDGFARIWGYLLSADGTFDYYYSHPEDVAILTEVANADDTKAQAFLADYNQKASLAELIPIDYDAYTDDFAYYTEYHIYLNEYYNTCPKILCLTIEDNTGGNEQAAKDKIKELGYNPDDYDIEYTYVPIYGSEINTDSGDDNE